MISLVKMFVKQPQAVERLHTSARAEDQPKFEIILLDAAEGGQHGQFSRAFLERTIEVVLPLGHDEQLVLFRPTGS